MHSGHAQAPGWPRKDSWHAVILAKANRIPPRMCRILARTLGHSRILTVREISCLSGLSISAVNRISRLGSWETVTVGDMDRYTKACGIDLNNIKRTVDHFKRRFPAAMVHCCPAQKAMIARAFQELTRK